MIYALFLHGWVQTGVLVNHCIYIWSRSAAHPLRLLIDQDAQLASARTGALATWCVKTRHALIPLTYMYTCYVGSGDLEIVVRRICGRQVCRRRSAHMCVTVRCCWDQTQTISTLLFVWQNKPELFFAQCFTMGIQLLRTGHCNQFYSCS